MDHASFIIGSWVLTFASVIAYAVFVIKRSRNLSQHAKREDMPWT